MAFDPIAFHRQAVQTPSHDDVTAMRSLLVDTLDDAGHPPDIDAAGNVRATRGTDDSDGTHLVLNTHLDTVPPHVPYEADSESDGNGDGDIVRGRGACDAKGPLAALVDAFLSASIDTDRLTLAVTPDEETAQFGGAHLGATLAADGYIVGEPTGLDVCHAARGAYGGEVTIYGESAHASTPTSGTNPLSVVGSLMEALEQYDDQRGPDTHAVLGDPTLVPTRIEGGGPLNQIPDRCTVSFDRRPVPPETSDAFFADLDEYLGAWCPAGYEVAVAEAYPDSPSPDAFVTAPDRGLVRTLAAASGGAVRVFEAASDASYLAPNAPTVVFGPGVLVDADGPVAHAEREYIRLSEVGAAAEAVRVTVERLLG